MREIPFLRHPPPVPLSGVGGSGRRAGDRLRRVVVRATSPDDGVYAARGGYAVVLIPAEQQGGECDDGSFYRHRGYGPGAADAREESRALRGLSSVYYSKGDDRAIFTRGVAGERGVLLISVRDAGGEGDKTMRDVEEGEGPCGDLEVDLSRLADAARGGTASFEHPAVGTACFVNRSPSSDEGRVSDEEGEIDTGPPAAVQSHLILRAVDPHGTVLSLALSYPGLEPVPADDGAAGPGPRSFLLPLFPGREQLRPHPGSLAEGAGQACFPTPSTVIFSLSPHLYCVDFGSDQGAPVTRVWTGVHRLVSDPVADSIAAQGGGSAVTATPRKRPRQSMGGILAGAAYILMGMTDYGVGEDYEYNDDDEPGGNHPRSIPSIAALANLPALDDDGEGANAGTARVATLHSDGSLRVWNAEPSCNDAKKGQLRIPSVQRVAISGRTGGWTSSDLVYTDAPLPRPSTWDPSPDAISLGGYCKLDQRSEEHLYEVVVHVRCHSAYGRPRQGGDGEENWGSVFVLRGSMIPCWSGEDVTHTTRMQELALPDGTKSVADLSWSATGGGVMALLRAGGPTTDEQDIFFDGGQDEGLATMLALYPLDGRRGTYSKEPTLLDLDHQIGCSPFGCFSAEEELGRYLLCNARDGSDGIADEIPDDSMDGTAADTTSRIAEAEAKVDKAGLLAILQPFGRPRPSSLAIYRAMSGLGLLDRDVGPDDVVPSTIVFAARRWKKSAELRLSSGTVVPFEDEAQEDNDGDDPPAASAGGLSIYEAFANTSKESARPNEDTEGGEHRQRLGASNAEAAEQSHRSRWARLLLEISRQEARLDGALCLARLPGVASHTNLLVWGSAISVLSMDNGAQEAPRGRAARAAAGLDELALGLMEHVRRDPDLRRLLCSVESALHDASSSATPLVEGWFAGDRGVELLSQTEALGRSALRGLSPSGAQLKLLGELSRPSGYIAEEWLGPPASASPSVSKKLGIWNPRTPVPNSAAVAAIVSGARRPCQVDPVLPAAYLVFSQVESARLLSLSRLLLVLGSPRGASLQIRNSALRPALYSAALSWAIHQRSGDDKGRTFLEECLSRKVSSAGDCCAHWGVMAASPLADMFVASAFGHNTEESTSGDALLELIPPTLEPRVALRLLAPLVEFPEGRSAVDRRRRDAVAECLLVEAAAVSRRPGSGPADRTPPEALWVLASKMLLDPAADGSRAEGNLTRRVEILERHLTPMVGGGTCLPQCCGVVLEAVRDALPLAEDGMEEAALRSIAFLTAMQGGLWDEALRTCISNPSDDLRESDLRRLILGMVDAGALGKLVDMSLTVVGRNSSESGDDQGGSDVDSTNRSATVGVDLFNLAARVIEEAAVDQSSSPSSVTEQTNYWGCLYTLHASRGNWRQAAYIMDMCGKAMAGLVSSPPNSADSQKPPMLSRSVSKRIMDDACLSAQACAHALSLVDSPSCRYLLPGGTGDNEIPTELRLLRGEDLERRAARAVALRALAMDECSPNSVGAILGLGSLDTIDSLARLGYYDHAITVALGISSKRKDRLPGGVDVFEDALKHILRMYLVPAAIRSHKADDGDGIESLQSRSKVAQIQASSSACALSVPIPGQSAVTPSSANSKSRGEKAVQRDMAMGLLRQYTEAYSGRCPGLGLAVADAILQAGDGASELPPWLVELCAFDIPGAMGSGGGLFARRAGDGVANPAALVRLFIKHEKYGEACDVVASVLSRGAPRQGDTPGRLPEKGRIDYVPYDLIDMLWDMIESIVSSNRSSPSEGVRSQVESLVRRRSCMEKAIEGHFESLRISEAGLKSARSLSCA